MRKPARTALRVVKRQVYDFANSQCRPVAAAHPFAKPTSAFHIDAQISTGAPATAMTKRSLEIILAENQHFFSSGSFTKIECHVRLFAALIDCRL
jgi:hypothetical protein